MHHTLLSDCFNPYRTFHQIESSIKRRRMGSSLQEFSLLGENPYLLHPIKHFYRYYIHQNEPVILYIESSSRRLREEQQQVIKKLSFKKQPNHIEINWILTVASQQGSGQVDLLVKRYIAAPRKHFWKDSVAYIKLLTVMESQKDLMHSSYS